MELRGHGGRCACGFIYLFFNFFPADEADGVTVRSVAIALGEFPAAVAAAESNRKAASRGRGTTSDSSYSDYRGKKKANLIKC